MKDYLLKLHPPLWLPHKQFGAISLLLPPIAYYSALQAHIFEANPAIVQANRDSHVSVLC
jgi:hypothetical protein